MEHMTYGGIDMSRFSLGTLSRFFPELWTLQLPYLYTDSEHMWRVLDGDIGDMYLREMSGKGIIGLASYDAGARSFYTITPISSFASLQDLTIRVQENDMMSRTSNCLVPRRCRFPMGMSILHCRNYESTGRRTTFPVMCLWTTTKRPLISIRMSTSGCPKS